MVDGAQDEGGVDNPVSVTANDRTGVQSTRGFFVAADEVKGWCFRDTGCGDGWEEHAQCVPGGFAVGKLTVDAGAKVLDAASGFDDHEFGYPRAVVGGDRVEFLAGEFDGCGVLEDFFGSLMSSVHQLVGSRIAGECAGSG